MASEAPTNHITTAVGFRFFPDDARQALRMRRYLLAAATSLLLPLLLFVMAFLGYARYEVAGWCAALVGFLIVLFFVLFRTGWNLRFADPSLTGEQILAGILSTAYVSYHASSVRPAVAMFYLIALLFGALRLNAARLFVLAAIAMLAQATVVFAWHRNHPGADLADSLIDLAALAIVLPWFAAMGAYVNSMRSRLSDSHRQLKDAYDRMQKIAIRDELTGIYNRRFLIDALGRERARARRLGSGFAVCLFDIDHFKSINDTYGHAAGDAVLKHFAAIAPSGLRDVDIFGRYGGEEFLLVLPDTNARGGSAAAERVRAAVHAAGFPQMPAERRVSVSVGVAASRSDESVDALLARADKALYEAKAGGRNRVVAAA